ncbi:MAG TPA: hypothetical protein VFE47_15555 [Tepidisphaeraceae bacterium]|jgi:hypothetical protein|nr:hypothetical protein [Tepidisphaeraceae bacterium]
MDRQELDAWREFCEGRGPYPEAMFSNLFMGMFAEPLSEDDERNLRTVFGYIPNSSRALDWLLRLGHPADAKGGKRHQDIADLVNRDLSEMRPLINSKPVLAAMGYGVDTTVSDEAIFWNAFVAPSNVEYIDSLGDYYGRLAADMDEKLRALSDAFYKIAFNLHLQFALSASLVNSNCSFDNYLELYLAGADYALGTTGAIIYIHKQ